jgi:hypothetical protein
MAGELLPAIEVVLSESNASKYNNYLPFTGFGAFLRALVQA